MHLVSNLIKALIKFMLIFGFGYCQNSSCPDAAQLSPYCFCSESLGITLDCSLVRNEDELESIFTTTTFPTLNAKTFKIWNNQDLKYLTRNVFGDVTFELIDLSHDVLEYIDESTFIGSINTLTTWVIKNCYLAVGRFPFETLNSYTVLNNLDFSNAGTFEILPKMYSNSITSLYFDHCQVQFLPSLVFNELPNLRVLYLASNNISSVTPRIFESNPRLKEISFYNNSMKTVEIGTFQNLLELNSLFLNHNQISRVDPNTSLPSLETLYLDNNILQELECLGNLSSLHTIHFHDNQLEVLNSNSFIGCPNLKTIYAFNMNISVIEAGSFNNAPKYGYILLNNNYLTTLDESWLGSALRNNNKVDVTGNPLQCGCDMGWLFDNPSLMADLTAYCKNGTNIRNLDPNFFSNC